MILRSFRERKPFPGQDPWVVPHEGSLLLIQSARNDRQIVIKRFHDLHRMDRNEKTVIWDPRGKGDHSREIWAPELHHLDGRWYVYYTASDGENRNHRMYVLEADHPLGPYREVGRLCDPDHDTWAIDVTVFGHHGELYAAWSGWEREDDGFPQNLYVAAMANPWTISGERRLISRPEYAWETSVAAVNEAPEVIRSPRHDRVFILYSADASWTHSYKLGLLELVGRNVTAPGAWAKLPEPLLVGGGHGCVVEAGGGLHLVYHRKTTTEPGWCDREIVSEPLVWDSDGYPVLAQQPSALEGPPLTMAVSAA
jgi:GH43 family beta-xylosidase